MTQNIKSHIIWWFLIICLIPYGLNPIKGLAQSQPEITASSPFLPLGSGARAMGIGGAFIAVADDATAASWNPAGLVKLKRPEISLVGNIFIREDHSILDAYPDASTSERLEKYRLNYLSFVIPARFLGRNFTFSLNYQHLYDINLCFHRKWHYQNQPEGSPLAFDRDITWDYQRKGRLFTISPSLAIQVLPSLSLGMTLNLWPEHLGPSDNGWTKEFFMSEQGTANDGIQTFPINRLIYKCYRYTFSGTNFHFGFLWHVNSILSLGGVLKTSFTADLDREEKEILINQDNYVYKEKPEDQSLTMPPSYGIGISGRFSDYFTISLDLYRTEWDKHRLKTSEGTYSAVTDDYIESSNVKPTHHARLGMEYLMITRTRILALRSGIFYDPDPARDKPNDFYGFSLGAGLASKAFAIDLAYQYRFADDISTFYFEGEADRNRVTQQFIYLSTIYYL